MALAASKISKSWLVVIIPMTLFFVYLAVIAKERYRAEATYVIHDLSSEKNVGVDLGLFGSSSSGQKLDADIVKTYLMSMDMLYKVDIQFDLRDHYRSSRTELTERLLWYSTDEDFLALYRKHMRIVAENDAGITYISFEDTDPELSVAVLKYLLEAGEDFLNELNHNRAEKKITFVTSQLDTNKANLNLAIHQLEGFQDRHRMVDPSADVALSQSIIASLESEIVTKTAAYNQLISYMAPNTIDVLKLEKEIEELQAALNKLKNRLSGGKSGPLNELMFEYQKLKNNVDFATEVYKNTLVQYELNKIEVLQNSKVFEVIAKPRKPDGHVHPMRLKMTLTIFILLLIVHYSVVLLWAIIKDHKD